MSAIPSSVTHNVNKELYFLHFICFLLSFNLRIRLAEGFLSLAAHLSLWIHLFHSAPREYIWASAFVGRNTENGNQRMSRSDSRRTKRKNPFCFDRPYMSGLRRQRLNVAVIQMNAPAVSNWWTPTDPIKLKSSHDVNWNN